MIKRVVLIILDACGVGELPDASDYGDLGAATIPNIAEAVDGLHMPNSRQLGLGNIVPIKGVAPVKRPTACFGRMAEKSPGKDSTTGHWEIGGLVLERPFPTYPDGFPEGLVDQFEKKAGVQTIGNYPASGTAIIDELGAKHMETGEIILYTSADSVFQLAAHEEIIPLDRLYQICEIARGLLTDEHAVGRVIARPFVGTPGNFSRTVNRKDFSLLPPGETFLDQLKRENIPTISIGKIFDLFAGRGFSKTVKAKNNQAVVENVISETIKTNYGVVFANLVDFDMLWGHRNDVESFAEGLEEFDKKLPELLKILKENDLLIITADHGCDPTLKHSTDHTREYVPLLAYNKKMGDGLDLGTRETMADIATTIAEIFGLDYNFPGKSFQETLMKAIRA